MKKGWNDYSEAFETLAEVLTGKSKKFKYKSHKEKGVQERHLDGYCRDTT